MDEKKAVNSWLLRKENMQNIIRRIVSEVVQSVEDDYDSIDMLMDLLASTVTDEVREYLEHEYEVSYSEGHDGLLTDSEPYSYGAVFEVIDGKTFEDRIAEYVADFAADLDEDALNNKVALLALTDGHRVRADARQAAGEELASVGYTVTKTWRSMKIPTTRDTHWMLDGTTIPIDGYFETVNGRAKYPGGFGLAEEDCNCICYLQINVTGG